MADSPGVSYTGQITLELAVPANISGVYAGQMTVSAVDIFGNQITSPAEISISVGSTSVISFAWFKTHLWYVLLIVAAILVLLGCVAKFSRRS
ncbi:MAG: hypothetical protein ABSF44_15460 [Candidatus Bathyarchaeia archaeon]